LTGAAQRLDSDGDGLYDDDEAFVYGTDPFGYDSDGDGVGDGEEVYYGTNPLIGEQVVLEEPPADPVVVDGGTVGDGGCSSVDAAGNCNGGIAVADTRASCRAEGASCTSDSDGDGVGDGEEVYYGTNPLIGEQGVLEEPADGSGGVVVDGGSVGYGEGDGGVAVVDTRASCRGIGVSCSYDSECCGPNVLCCFDGTTLTTRCTDVTVYGGACL